jgi:hypothetical protein
MCSWANEPQILLLLGLWLILLYPRKLSVKSAHTKLGSLHRAFYGKRPDTMSKLEPYISLASEILLG